MYCSSVEVKESQRQSSNDHEPDDADNVLPMTDENKKLVTMQGEEHLHNKLLSETMNTA